MGKVAFLFPGQGSQAVGMGKALAEQFPVAARTFEEADEALGFSIRALCLEGPEEELRRTAITQPAILTVSVAAWRVLQAEVGTAAAGVCGHSLGEYSALVAAGGLALADAVKAVHARGQLMQNAVPQGVGAMAAVLGLEAARITEICARVSTPAALVEVANYNGPDQTVISGHKAGVEAASAELKAAGAKRVMPLPVSAPFHCGLMAPVQEPLAAVLPTRVFKPLTVPVYANVTALPNQDGPAHRSLLLEQVVRSVRFTESVAAMVAAGFDTFVELGPGKVLSGIVKRIDKGLKLCNVEDPGSLAATRAVLTA